MPLSTAGKNLCLQTGGGLPATVYAALHSASPPTAGNELTGGSPAYARKAVTLAAPSGGARAFTGLPVTFDVPPGATVACEAYWDTLTVGAGSMLFYFTPTTPEVFANQGKADLNAGSVSLSDVAGG